jgi:hypothetical protein
MTNIEFCPLSVYLSASNHTISLVCSTCYHVIITRGVKIWRFAAGGEA